MKYYKWLRNVLVILILKSRNHLCIITCTSHHTPAQQVVIYTPSPSKVSSKPNEEEKEEPYSSKAGEFYLCDFPCFTDEA